MKTKKTHAAKDKSSTRPAANAKSKNGREKFESNGNGLNEGPVNFSHNQKGKLETFLIDGLKDMFYAEKVLVKALAKMQNDARSEELRQALNNHRIETEDHVGRLEEVFEMLGEKATAIKCEAIEGITKEVDRMFANNKNDDITSDAALIFGGQKVEHYEIASYTTLIELARSLEKDEVADLLEETLEEEISADQTLGSIAENIIYQHATA